MSAMLKKLKTQFSFEKAFLKLSTAQKNNL